MESQIKKADEKNISKSKQIRKKVKNAESTILKRYKIDLYVFEDLGKVLNNAYCSFRPVSADYEARKDLVKSLNTMAIDIYDSSEERSPVLEAYGSFVMDMFSSQSDLDVSINFGNETSELSRDKKLEILRRFAEKLHSLEGQGFVRNIVSIFGARVPIVKFFDQGAAVECDLSVENKGGILNSQIIRIISQIDDRFQKLCMLVKLWAKTHEVNSAFYGTLNSVSLTLLVAFHLQTQNPPILPPFSVLFKDGIDPPKVEKRTQKFLNRGQRNKESLGRLFATFFIKLQSVEFLWRQGLCVSVLNGLWISKNISKKRKKVGLGSICVEDFTDVSQNVARRVSGNGVKKIYSSINRTVDDIFEFLNGEVSETYLRRRLFGQQAVVERHPSVLPLNEEIAGTHLKHSLFSQQAVVETPPPVPSLDGKIVGTHVKHNLISQQAVAEPPPPVPPLNEEIAGTHLKHRLFSQQAVVEPPPSVPSLDGKIVGTHVKHNLISQQAVAEPPPPVSPLNEEIAGTHLKHNLFSQQAVVEPPPPVPSLDGKILGTHLKHKLISQQAVAEPPPPVPPLNEEISGTHLKHSLFSQQAVVERPPPVPSLDGKIVGTHLKHNLISQQVVAEPAPVPLHNGNVTETDRKHRLFGNQVVMEPPPLPSLNGRIAGTHLKHRLFGQPAAVEPPPPGPQFNDKIAGTHLRHGVFGQPTAMERPPPVSWFDDKIAGTHLKHGVFGQPAAMEGPPPVPWFNDKIAGTHLGHGVFGQPTAMERPPPVPWFDDKIAGTHLKHGVFGQPAAMECPPQVPWFNDMIAGTHLGHGVFGQPAAMERLPHVPRFDDKIAGTHLKHGVFGQPAAMERPPHVPWFNDNISGTHLRHGVFGQPAVMERPPPLPWFNDKIAGTHLRHGVFGQPAAMERPPPVLPLNVYPQQPHNNYMSRFNSPPEVHHNKRVCLENSYRAVDGMGHSREEERRYEDLRNKYAGNYNTFEEFREVPWYGIHNNPSGDPYRQVLLNGGANGHLVHHRHDGRFSGEEQMPVGHWQDYSHRIGPSPPPLPYGSRIGPYESFGLQNIYEPPYICRPFYQ